MKKGKLIVIEGGDGSGKTIQAKLLVKYLKNVRISTDYFDFPQYKHSFHGETVAKFLRGELGKIYEVSPYLASLPFALDRASTKDRLLHILNKGHFIVANRYATSNLVYQAAKFASEKERGQFIKWVTRLEYEINGIPRENIIIYLDVPWRIGLKLTNQKAPREYLRGRDDIHENHTGYRQRVEKLYLKFVDNNENWVKIDCVKNGKLLSPDKIHSEVIEVLKKRSVI